MIPFTVTRPDSQYFTVSTALCMILLLTRKHIRIGDITYICKGNWWNQIPVSRVYMRYLVWALVIYMYIICLAIIKFYQNSHLIDCARMPNFKTWIAFQYSFLVNLSRCLKHCEGAKNNIHVPYGSQQTWSTELFINHCVVQQFIACI